MNVKRFMPWFLLLSLAAALGAQPPVPPPAGEPAPAVPTVPIPSRSPAQGTRRNTNAPAFPIPARSTVDTILPPTTPAAGPPAMGALAPVAGKPAAAGEDAANILYDFQNAPVEQLLEIYSGLVQRTLLHSSSGPAAVPSSTTITLKTESDLTRAEAIEAIETVLGMNGITIVPIGEKFAKVVMEAAAPKAGGLIAGTNVALPEAGKFVTEIVQVKYTDVQDLAKVLDPFSRMSSSIIALPSTQTLILRDYAENVARMLEMVKRIDVSSPLIVKPRVIAIKYALASDIASALGQLGASAGGSVGKSTSGATGFGAGSSRGGNGMSGNGFGGGGANGMQGGVGSVPGQPTSTSGMGSAATSARSSFQQNLSKIVQNAAGAGTFQLFGQTKVIADERTNSLLVFANDDDMKMITNIIDKLDVVLAQVLIDTIIMEVNLEGAESQGVSFVQPQQNVGKFSGVGGVNNLSSGASSFLTGPTGSNGGSGLFGVPSSTLASLPAGTLPTGSGGQFSYFSKFGNDLDVVMEAVAGNSRINVLSRPRIQTSHAVPADLFIGETVPYITSSYSYLGSGPSANYSQLEIGIHLQVLPLINPDGLVVMDIQADVEGITGNTSIGGNSVPITSKRQAGAKVAVRDGETIILGGFIQDTRSKSDSGVPYLKDIPYLGNLFKSSAFDNKRTELIMLMRPTVLPTPAIAAVVASTERNKLSGVKQAELEIRQEESDRNAAIEVEMAKEAAKRAKRDAERAKAAPVMAPAPVPVAEPTNSIEDEYLKEYLRKHPANALDTGSSSTNSATSR